MKLVIAEKPSVAGEISKVLGSDKKERGYYSGNGYYVSWCVGHLITLANPEDYDPALKKWNLSSLPIIPQDYKTVISEKTADQYKLLEKLIKLDDVTEIICATDAGREGELIFRLVYNKTGSKKTCKRLWISSLEEKSIRDGFSNLKDSKHYDNLYHAAQCRQYADWLVGMNITRLYTVKYGKLLHVGRVQTPTVNLIVKRQREIDNFVSSTYFAAIADFGSFKASSREFDTMDDVESLIAKCKNQDGVIRSIKKENKKESPKALYDLTTLQRDANRLLDYSAQQTLDILQSLYEKKLTTYPRTDSRYLTSDMEASTTALISQILTSAIIGEDILKAYDEKLTTIGQVINDKKVTDHHAIIPTSRLSKSEMDKLTVNEKNVLLLIIIRLLSAPYAPYLYVNTKVEIDVNGEDFYTTGKEITQEGFKQLENQIRSIIKEVSVSANESDGEADNPDTILPPLAEGDILSIKDIGVKKRKSQPPKPYTEDSLLSAMETAGKNITDNDLKTAIKGKGLGTPATRASIIENIINSGYIQRKKKQLVPSETAYTFIDLIPDKLKEAALTAEWEKQLEEINEGQLSASVFMDGISGFIRNIVDENKQNTSSDDKSVFQTEKESLGQCPRCGKKVVEYSKSYSCVSGKDGCGFVIWKTVSSKDVSITQAKKLLNKRKTDLIKGFKSKAGKEFNAYIILNDDNTTGFEFEKKK